MTDGKSQLDTEPQDYNTIKKIANQIKSAGVSIYTIGVGPSVSEKELFAISSGDTPRKKEKNFMFNAVDFDHLAPVLASLEDQLCEPSYELAAIPILCLIGFLVLRWWLDRREERKFMKDEEKLRNSLQAKRWESGFTRGSQS